MILLNVVVPLKTYGLKPRATLVAPDDAPRAAIEDTTDCHPPLIDLRRVSRPSKRMVKPDVVLQITSAELTTANGPTGGSVPRSVTKQSDGVGGICQPE